LQATSYRIQLSDHVELSVWFATDRGVLVNYAVVLIVEHDGAWHTVRVYDNAHGQNEMHRHTLGGGKQPARPFHEGDCGEAMRIARDEVLARYENMIEGWRH